MRNTFSKQIFCIYFIHEMYTKACRNVGYILCIKILYICCVCQFWSTRKVHHKYYVYNLYIKFIQHVYTNNCMLRGSLISTFFILFIVHVLVDHCKQLRFENCNLTTGVTIKSKDYWIIYSIKMPVIKLNKSKSPCIYRKNTKFV